MEIVRKKINERRKEVVLRILAFILFFNISFLPYSFGSELAPEIRQIEITGLHRIDNEEFLDMMLFRVGDILDRKVLRMGIKRAFKKGIFFDIKAVSEPYESGIKMKYIVEEIPVIKKVKIMGNEFVQKRKIKKAFYFKKGDYFKDDYVDKASDGIKNFYERRGFPDARVTINTEKNKKKGYVKIELEIEEGPPLLIKKIKLQPEARVHFRVLEGDIFNKENIEKEIQKLRAFYKKQKHIKPVIGPYTFKNGELVVPFELGPKLQIGFQGNEVFSKKRLLEKVTFLEDEHVNPDLIHETARRINDVYRENGYYYSNVVGSLETDEGVVKVTFFVYEGKKVVLRKIRFEGVSIPLDVIKGVLPVEENKKYNQKHLKTAKESIIRFYNALGYIYADVTEIREEFVEQGSGLNLTFVVKEDRQVKIRKIDFSGNRILSSSRLSDILLIKEGADYNEIDIGDARYKILSLYYQTGYKDAAVEVDSVIDDDSAYVTFQIKENEPYVFGKTIIRGNEKTKNKIIRREFVFAEGEPYNYQAILKTRQRLYKLGLFTEISFETLETAVYKNGEDIIEGIHTQDLLIGIKEGKPGAIEVGLGYGDYEQYRGFLNISYRNLGGYNRTIGFRTELSSIKKRYILNFREPWFLNKPSLPLKVFLTKEDTRSVNIDTEDVLYKVDKISLLAGVEKEITEQLRAALNYEYSLVETTDVKEEVILSKEDTGTLGISSISPSLFYDTRDNPFNPTSGSLNGLIIKFASDILFSESEFIKTIVRSSWYFQLRKGLIFALSVRGGASHGFGESEELPIIERFFLGGRTTVRGYTQDTLGPKGAGDNPTGGNVFALMNTELRISLGKGFGLVTFVDGGNVWRRLNDMGSKLRYTTGAGLRYNTPVGPIRIDYGYKLNKDKGETAGELHFSLGHAF
jgi:outer membrane protein insertion porin family